MAAGLLFGVTVRAADGGELRQGSPRLEDLVRREQAAVELFRQQSVAGATELARMHDGLEGAPGSGPQAQELRALRLASGLLPVVGPGVSVTLTDAVREADGRYNTEAGVDDLVVHQQDMQSVLNGLWSGGAEAISIAGERITASSAPRCIGNTLLLNGRTFSPPYVIDAIGDADALTSSLAEEPGVVVYLQYVRAYGLGYSVSVRDEIDMPAFTGLLRAQRARSEGEPTP